MRWWWDKMDYIYVDENNKKQVGEITSLIISPLIQFEIQIENYRVYCSLSHISNNWSLYISNYEESIDLAHPTDTFWNYEEIYKLTKDKQLSKKIAYIIKTIYEQHNIQSME